MGIDQDRIEIERLMNLIRGFGWEMSTQEFTDTDIVVSVKKPRTPGEEEAGAGPS